MAPALIRSLAALCCLLVPLSSAFAASPEPTTDAALEQKRKNYLDARQALARNQDTRFKKLRAQLDDYPLAPYLDSAELRRRLHRLPVKEVNQFFDQYPNTVLAKRLRYQWLKQLGKSRQWDTYRASYLQRITDAELQCYYLRALYNTGEKKQALDNTVKLWLVGKSQPKACDPIFKEWIDEGYVSHELAWRRFDLAMQAGNVGLAKYLQRFLTQDQNKLADTYIRVHWTPTRITQKKVYSQDKKLADIVLHGLRRNSYRNPSQTAELWQHYHTVYQYDSETQTGMQRRIAAAMTVKGDEAMIDWLLQVDPAGKDTELLERRLRAGLAQQQWDHVKSWIAQLPESKANTKRWRYWLARALEQSGEWDAAEPLYQEIANTRSFYGFLAADRLKQSYGMEDQPTQPTDEQIAEVAALPSIQRAQEFFAIGQTYKARREWLHTSYGLKDAQLVAAGKLAESWGWHQQAILSMVQAEQWNDLGIRFPLAYADLIKSAASKTQLDINWIYAVARQESALAPDVRSGAGAMGLMQLMPATAKQTAKKSGINYRSKYELLNPKTNISLGTYYLKELLERYQGNRILASAAYNAGPHRVDKWRPAKTDTVPVDVWIENIPFRETREYVKNILAFSVIYGYRRGEETALIKESEYQQFAGQNPGRNQSQRVALLENDNKKM